MRVEGNGSREDELDSCQSKRQRRESTNDNDGAGTYTLWNWSDETRVQGRHRSIATEHWIGIVGLGQSVSFQGLQHSALGRC
jgi:hypothetical protein